MNHQLGTMENVSLDEGFSSSSVASFCKGLIYLEMETKDCMRLRGVFEWVIQRVSAFTSVRLKNEMDDIYRYFYFLPRRKKGLVCRLPLPASRDLHTNHIFKVSVQSQTCSFWEWIKLFSWVEGWRQPNAQKMGRLGLESRDISMYS